MEDDLWRSDDVVSKETASARFSDFPIRDEILRSMSAFKIFRPSPVQLKSLPHGLSGKSLLIQSKSGTGKTLVFAIIALNNLDTSQQPHQDPEAQAGKAKKSKKKTRQTRLRQAASGLQAVVVSPTREIALQIADEITRLGWYIFPKLSCICCVGGVPHNQEIARLIKTKCHILVATPGRLAFIFRSGYRIRGKQFRCFALDEADRLLDSQFRYRVTQLIEKCVDYRVQFVAASATFSPSQVEFIEVLLANIDGASHDNRAKDYYGEVSDEEHDEKRETETKEVQGNEGCDGEDSTGEIEEIEEVDGEEDGYIEESKSNGNLDGRETVQSGDLGVEVCRDSTSMDISQTEDEKIFVKEAVYEPREIVYKPREIVYKAREIIKVFLCSSFNMDRLATASNIEVVEVATLKENSVDDMDSFRLRANACFEVLFTVPFRQALIFCNDRESGENIVEALNGVGVSSVYTSGSLPQSQRMKSLQAVKSLQSRILICSDVISRGVDLLSVDLVINFDLPLDRDTFLHRSGRAGRPGTCVCLGHLEDAMSIQYFAMQLGISISDFDMNAAASFAANAKVANAPHHTCDEEQIEVKFSSSAERQNLPPMARGGDLDVGPVVKRSEICSNGFAQVEGTNRSLLLESLDIKYVEDNLVDRLPNLLKDMVEFWFSHSEPKMGEGGRICGVKDCNGVLKDFMANHATIWSPLAVGGGDSAIIG